MAGLSIKLVSDLKEVLERLNQNPTNSSRPSGSLGPWDKGIADEKEEDDESIFQHSPLADILVKSPCSSEPAHLLASHLDLQIARSGNKPRTVLDLCQGSD